MPEPIQVIHCLHCGRILPTRIERSGEMRVVTYDLCRNPGCPSQETLSAAERAEGEFRAAVVAVANGLPIGALVYGSSEDFLAAASALYDERRAA